MENARLKEAGPTFFYGYVVVAAAWVIFVAVYGVHYAFGIFLKPMLAEFGWGRAVISGAYSLSWLWLSLKDKRSKLENLTENTSQEFREKKMIIFRDETEKLRFSIKSRDILFVESTDNYVTVHTSEKGKIKKIMLRNTMKRLEKELDGTLIHRCHRSYMVNFENIKLVKLISTNLYIYKDFHEEIRIPVSRTYAEHVHEFLNRVAL